MGGDSACWCHPYGLLATLVTAWLGAGQIGVAARLRPGTLITEPEVQNKQRQLPHQEVPYDPFTLKDDHHAPADDGSRALASLQALYGAGNDTTDRLPHYDVVIAVLVRGTFDPEGVAEKDRLRRVYDRYNGSVAVVGKDSHNKPYKKRWSIRYVFVVDSSKFPGGGTIDGDGLLVGDTFYVKARPGYEYISDKVLGMMALRTHMKFNFLIKADADTFPCLARTFKILASQNARRQRRMYAGLLTKCGGVMQKGHRWHDEHFLRATGGVLQCHPMYHQGAFYILGADIVKYLYLSRYDFQLMTNEDAMVGLWMVGVKKALLDIGGLLDCECSTSWKQGRTRDAAYQQFFHRCKTDGDMRACAKEQGVC